MEERPKSLRFIISILFIVLIILTCSTISLIIFSKWIVSVRDFIAKIELYDRKDILAKIEALIGVPLYINQTNQHLLADNIIDIHNQRDRERFFAGVLQANNQEIYSFSYGTENGEYYGARRNVADEIEIMKNNAQTGGHSWYYAMTKDRTAGKFVKDYGQFDPRTRDWYKAAKEKQGPVFSPIYKHFVKNDLTISAAYPVYNKNGSLEGVLGTHIILSQINHYLKEIAAAKKATAYIVEKNSGELVANSLGMPNFKSLGHNRIKRITIVQTGNRYIIRAFQNYATHSVSNDIVKTSNDRWHISVAEYCKSGLDWLIITATPESQFMTEIVKSLIISVILSLVALLAAVLIYLKGTEIILRPIYNLIDTTEKFSRGDFSQRIKVSGNDEFAKLGKAFNKMAAELCLLINNLEDKIKERTLELERTNDSLKRSEASIRLLLDSTAEAIYGIDTQGNCTFCNPSCLKILGYKNQDELIGKNTHFLFHSRDAAQKLISLEECQVHQALIKGKGTHVAGEVFWRADGTSFPVEYFSYPLFQDGAIVGCVVTFFDITERQKTENEIIYLSYRDQLTGLYNRRFFEEDLRRKDVAQNYPLTIIFADMNGLKLINDSFGHAVGDELLKKVAAVLKKGCRVGDVIARLGGDEFVVLLPKTEPPAAEQIIERIKHIASNEKVNSIDLSISFGYGTKYDPEEPIQDILKQAEDHMYKNKLTESPSMRGKTIHIILRTLHEKNTNEEAHSHRVSQLCGDIGTALGLLHQDVEELTTVGLLHDIGKVAIAENILAKTGPLTGEEWEEIKRHAEVGYRILSTVNDMAELAEYVLAHHERWDGRGYPKGLQGATIPLPSRIVALADAYDAMTNERSYRSVLTQAEAIAELQNNAGSQFDPQLVRVFITKVLKNK